MKPSKIARLITEDPDSPYNDLVDDDKFDGEPNVVYYIVEVYAEEWGSWEENEHYNERTAEFHGPYNESPIPREE
jgi:hypothetical protein